MSNIDKSKDVKDEQFLNIQLIEVTDAVLKLEISKYSKDLQY